MKSPEGSSSSSWLFPSLTQLGGGRRRNKEGGEEEGGGFWCARLSPLAAEAAGHGGTMIQSC